MVSYRIPIMPHPSILGDEDSKAVHVLIDRAAWEMLSVEPSCSLSQMQVCFTLPHSLHLNDKNVVQGNYITWMLIQLGKEQDVYLQAT